jgi:hypothetical protein
MGSESCVGRAFAISIGRSFNRRACPRKGFRAVFFLRKFFRNSVSFNVPQAAARYAAGAIRRHNCAAGKTSSGRKENRAARVAFSLLHHSSGELMFETCVNRRPELSAFRGVEFHVE